MIPTAALALTLALALLGQGSTVPEIEVTDLAKRTDLLGKEVLVDGRVLYYHIHPNKGYDEIELDLSAVPLVLPPALAFREAPKQKSVRAQGTLKREGNRTVLEVRSLQVQPPDMERFESALRPLPASELTRRQGWARWAARRAVLYKDEALRKRARQVEAECARIEASRPEVKTPEAVLAVARKARQNQVVEPTPSALAHRAFRAWAAAAKSPDELRKIAAEIEAFFPDAKRPLGTPPPDWDRQLAAYIQDPEPTYIQAEPPIRAALDRMLLADVRQQTLLAKAAADPRDAFDLAAQARELLPDRPQLATQLRDQGLASAIADVSRLRENEVIGLAREYENAGRSNEGTQLKRAWLEDQRKRKLGASDAEGRVGLAEKYLAWVQDRTTAVTLLTEADAIDPQSATAVFRRLGFRREAGRWMEAGSERPTDAVAADSERLPGAGDDPLLGLTPDEVLARQGKPTHRSIEMTQGSLLIQWIYETGRGGRQVVTFVQKPGSPPTVVSRFGLH